MNGFDCFIKRTHQPAGGSCRVGSQSSSVLHVVVKLQDFVAFLTQSMYYSIRMIKKQVASFLPIPESQSTRDLVFFREFDDSDITYLNSDYQHLPSEDATVALLDPYVTARGIDNKHRPTYEAGVVLAAIVGRTRLFKLGRDDEASDIFSLEAVFATNWHDMKLSRFALRQFHEDSQFVEHLREQVELPWFEHHSHYSLERPDDTHPDWLAVGYGDLMRTIQIGEAILRSSAIPIPDSIPLAQLH